MSTNAKQYLEKVRGKLTLGSAIRSIRLCEEKSQTAFAKKIKNIRTILMRFGA